MGAFRSYLVEDLYAIDNIKFNLVINQETKVSEKML